MNVLFLTHRLPYAPNRGDRIRAYHLLQEMSRFASVSVFSLIHDDAEQSQIAHVPFAAAVRGAPVPQIRNAANAALHLLSDRPVTLSMLDSPVARASLSELMRSTPPDVVVAYCSSMARFAMEPPLASVPFVLDMVDVDSAKWSEMAARSRWPVRMIYGREARTLARFEAAAVQKAAATMVVTAREQSLLKKLAPGAAVEVVGNGVDAEAFRPAGPPSPDPVVVFCGVMDYYPNDEGACWFVSEIWPRVRAVRPDARFVVVGPGPSRNLRQLAGGDPTIELTGRVDRVQEYLWKSAVAVAPLRLARGVQNKVLEALAAGLPAVVTAPVMAGLPDAVRAGCVPAETPEAFASEVVRLLGSSPAERRRIAESARTEKLSWRAQLGPLRSILNGASAARLSSFVG
jgi:sugar transferase (PEP-CTERM/EpsH1 system associated)